MRAFYAASPLKYEDLTGRTRNALFNSDLPDASRETLERLTEAEAKRIPNMGSKSLKELRERLVLLGVWGDGLSPVQQINALKDAADRIEGELRLMRERIAVLEAKARGEQ